MSFVYSQCKAKKIIQRLKVKLLVTYTTILRFLFVDIDQLIIYIFVLLLFLKQGYGHKRVSNIGHSCTKSTNRRPHCRMYVRLDCEDVEETFRRCLPQQPSKFSFEERRHLRDCFVELEKYLRFT